MCVCVCVRVRNSFIIKNRTKKVIIMQLYEYSKTNTLAPNRLKLSSVAP